MAFANLIGGVMDPYVIDGAVNGVARLAGTLSVAVRRLHPGYVRRYALALMAGVPSCCCTSCSSSDVVVGVGGRRLPLLRGMEESLCRE